MFPHTKNKQNRSIEGTLYRFECFTLTDPQQSDLNLII